MFISEEERRSVEVYLWCQAVKDPVKLGQSSHRIKRRQYQWAEPAADRTKGSGHQTLVCEELCDVINSKIHQKNTASDQCYSNQ